MPMKPRGKPFKPGQSGNPGGRALQTTKMKDLKKLTTTQLEELASLILTSNIEKLNEIAKSPTSSVLQVWVASGAMTGIKRGDLNALNAILDRIIGRVGVSIDHTTAGEALPESKIIVYEAHLGGIPVEPQDPKKTT